MDLPVMSEVVFDVTREELGGYAAECQNENMSVMGQTWEELRGNIKQGYYEGGHMIYLNRPAMEKLNGDLREFFESAAK